MVSPLTRPSSSTTSVNESAPRRLTRTAPGLALAGALAVVATVLGSHYRVVGAPVFAILMGITVALVLPDKASLRPGVNVAAKTVLKGSIVVLGTGLSFGEVLATGSSSLPVLLGTLCLALLGAWLIGRWLSIPTDLTTLIGVGTAICGASAIAATDAVINAHESDVSYAITTIFTFNVAAVLTFPAMGHLLHLSNHAFGLWAGTAVNDMSSVVAASSIYGKAALSSAVVVKLTRTLFIIPIVLALSYWRSRSTPDRSAGFARHWRTARRTFPTFIVWFLVAVLANSVRLVPVSWHIGLSDVAAFMITVALAGIGLSTKVRDFRRAGLRPLALGAALWILVASSSLAIQALTTKGF